MSQLKTTHFDKAPQGRSPLGAYIRHIMDGIHGNVILSTVPPGMTSRACQFKTIEEYWHVLEGEGEIWRCLGEGEEITALTPGISINIPAGTRFQYRNRSDEPLRFICTAMPPWPGDDEATIIDGPWDAAEAH